MSDALRFPDPFHLSPFMARAFEEDLGDGDHTTMSTIAAQATGQAQLKIKDRGTLAGVELAILLFHFLDPGLNVKIFLNDGDQVTPGQTAFTVSGSVHSILKAERVVLNCMQRMCGIATLTHQVVDQLRSTSTQLLDTRKTTPGFRYIERWAVHIGGGINHRFGLFDTILVKDNHVDFAGGMDEAISRVHAYLLQTHKKLKVIIEVRSFLELETVLSIGKIDRILLDNFSVPDLREAVRIIDGRFDTEASGSITLKNAREYGLTGVDYISMGALTHSPLPFDLSLKAFSC